MQVIAITGGIGSGKSTASRHFGKRGAVVLDVDAVAKSLSTTPGPTADRVIAAFGPRVAAEGGGVDAAALASEAFASPRAARKLDDIVHPVLLRELVNGLRELELMDRPPRVVILEVPLLVEAPAIAEAADRIIAVEAPEEVRVARMVQKGMDEEDVRARVAVQATDAQRAAMADTIIVNDGDEETFERELDAFWDREVGIQA